MNKQAKLIVRVICLHQFFHWFSVGIIIPVLTLFMMDRGFDLFEVGVCVALYSAMVFIFELPTGSLADQIGRKTVYLIATGVNLFGLILLLLLKYQIVLYIGFGLLGIGRSLSTGTIDAWAIDRFKTEEPGGNLQEVMAKVGIWISVGLGIGTLIGGLLPQLARYFLWERYIFNCLFMFFGLFWTGLFTIFWIHEDYQKYKKNFFLAFINVPKVLGEAFHFGFQNPTLFLLLSASLFWGITICGIENLWQPQVKTILGSEDQSWVFGILGAGYFFASALGGLVITPLCQLCKNHFASVLIFLRLTMGISILILALQNTIYLFGFFYSFIFLQNGMLNSPHDSMFHTIVTDDKRSIFISLESLFLSTGGIIGGVFLGWIARNHTISLAWIISGILFAGSSIFYLLFALVNKYKRS